jgi:hypothetical protein
MHHAARFCTSDAEARHRSDRLIGANPLTVQRVWG